MIKCQEGWEEINWRIIDFEDLKDKIVSEDYHVEKPGWIIEKDTKNIKNSNNNSNNNESQNANLFDHRNKRQKIEKEVSQPKKSIFKFKNTKDVAIHNSKILSACIVDYEEALSKQKNTTISYG